MDANLSLAFLQGWQDCLNEIDGLAPRTVETDYPDYTAQQIEAYLLGADDCAVDDTFRLALILNGSMRL